MSCQLKCDSLCLTPRSPTCALARSLVRPLTLPQEPITFVIFKPWSCLILPPSCSFPLHFYRPSGLCYPCLFLLTSSNPLSCVLLSLPVEAALLAHTHTKKSSRHLTPAWSLNSLSDKAPFVCFRGAGLGRASKKKRAPCGGLFLPALR